jgi:hypothetical protein
VRRQSPKWAATPLLISPAVAACTVRAKAVSSSLRDFATALHMVASSFRSVSGIRGIHHSALALVAFGILHWALNIQH